MAYENYRVVDTDAHYAESLPKLAEYFDDDDPWKDRFREGDDSWLPSTTPDHYLSGRIQRDEVEFKTEDGEMSAEVIPTAMEMIGVDAIVLISHKMLSFARLTGEDERPVKLANGYIDFMLDEIVDPDEGIYTMVVAPYQDPPAAVELIDRVADERGVVGVCMISAGAEPPLGNRRYEPIYEATQKADLPLIVHSGGSSLDHFYVKGYEKFIETHTLGFLWNNMAQLTSLVIQGIPEKFPNLDFVFQESGILYVPSLMARLDAEYLKRPSEAPMLEQIPSEYMKGFYYGTQPLDKPAHMGYFENAIEAMGGPSSIIYASDYPHWDYDPPKAITDISFLSESDKRQVLSENAKEVFGI